MSERGRDTILLVTSEIDKELSLSISGNMHTTSGKITLNCGVTAGTINHYTPKKRTGRIKNMSLLGNYLSGNISNQTQAGDSMLL